MIVHSFSRWIAAGCLAFALAQPFRARADFKVLPGWDLLTTDPVLTTFLGHNWRGVPLGTFNFGGAISNQSVGSTDTIVQRHAPATIPDPPGAPAADVIPIEIVALGLASVTPLDLGAGLGIHYLTLQSDRGGPASLGQMTVNFGTDAFPAGSFNSFFDVFFDIRIGGLDGPIIASDSLTITSQGNPWAHEPPPGLLLLDGVNHLLNGQDTANDFWPLQTIIETHPSGAVHAVNPTPAIPEAGAVWVLAPLGLVAVAKIWRRGRRRD